MRPPGEIRAALSEAARVLKAEANGATWRDMALRANVGFLAARRTVENMARSGELVPVGSAKVAHSKRWMVLYEPAAVPAAVPARGPAPGLDAVVRGWRARG